MLVESLGIDATNLVGVLNSLEDAGLIRRRRDRADRRRAIIELSTKGEQVLAKLDRALGEIDDEMLATLTASQREALSGLLAQAVENNPRRLLPAQRRGLLTPLTAAPGPRGKRELLVAAASDEVATVQVRR